MFFPCPHCQFLIAQHPQQRALPATCPRCGNALEDAGEPIEAAAGAIAGSEPASAADGVAPSGSGNEEDAPAGIDACPLQVDAPREPDATDAAADVRSPATGSPSSATTRIARTAPLRWLQQRPWAVIAALAVVLAIQVLLADRARLAADAGWRPALETVCGALRCALPAWHEPAAFTMIDRRIRPATDTGPGVLRVDASFRNDARWPQAWPALQLSLADADGRTLGSQVFLPAQYLDAVPDTLVAPGQSAQITFLVREPGPGTVAFSFEFR